MTSQVIMDNQPFKPCFLRVLKEKKINLKSMLKLSLTSFPKTLKVDVLERKNAKRKEQRNHVM